MNKPIAAAAPQPDPRELRAKTLKLDQSRALQRARARVKVTQREAAQGFGVPRSHVEDFESGQHPRSLSVLHLASAQGPAREVARDLTRWVAQQLDLFVSATPADRHGDDHGARLSSVIVECTDLPRVMAAALADGRLDDAELEQIEREARETREVAAEAELAAARLLARRRAER